MADNANASENVGPYPIPLQAHQLAAVAHAKETLHNLPMETAWEQLYKEGVTPWDMKQVTPVIRQLLEENKLREGLVLVPGCGSGYDVVAMASPTRHVVGVDISKTALEEANQQAILASKSPLVEFEVADFFSYAPPRKFDVIFDYTFFCAMEPKLWPKWASKMDELLSQNGELITLMFPLGDYEGGPPYAMSLGTYEKVLGPLGFVVSSQDHSIPSFPPRQGLESLVRWVRA